MTLHIRDETVQALAARVARARGVTITEAVRAGLERILAEHEMEQHRRGERIDAILARFRAMPPRREYGDAEMYDENGVPR